MVHAFPLQHPGLDGNPLVLHKHECEQHERGGARECDMDEYLCESVFWALNLLMCMPAADSSLLTVFCSRFFFWNELKTKGIGILEFWEGGMKAGA